MPAKGFRLRVAIEKDQLAIIAFAEAVAASEGEQHLVYFMMAMILYGPLLAIIDAQETLVGYALMGKDVTPRPLQGEGDLRLLASKTGGSVVVLEYIFIYQRFRGKGVGRIIMSLMADAVKLGGHSTLAVHTPIQLSRPFWGKVGFVETDDEHVLHRLV